VESHPVPQNIQSYQFRLVGDMTLTQFMQLAGGVVVGIIFYSLPIYGIIKWPLVLISVVLGIGMAFVPIEERPLNVWIAAFFKAVYSPTQYIWRKANKPPEILTQPFETKPLPAVEIIAPQGKEKLNEYLRSLPDEAPTPADEQAAEFTRKITGLFQTVDLPAAPAPHPIFEPTFEPTIEPHRLRPIVDTAEPAKPTINPTVSPTPIPAVVPLEPVKIPSQPHPELQNQPTEPSISVTPTIAPVAQRRVDAAKPVAFGQSTAAPLTPATPNIIVGSVLDSNRKIIESAILEIREIPTGYPVRAMKTNKLGQFGIITPLKNGNYQIITEKDGLTFETVQFQASGGIIQPVEILAKAASPN
jgi:hypothetical protein